MRSCLTILFTRSLLVSILFSLPGAASDLLLEARASYFYPLDERFRESCPGGGMYGLEFDYPIYRPLFGWAEVDYFYQNGHTQGDHDSTHLDMMKYSLGLKYIYRAHRFQPYVGFGPLATWVHTHVDSSFLIRSESRWGMGFLAKGGLFILIAKSCFIDLFTDYSWQKINFKRKNGKKVLIHNADVSGLSFGGAIGYEF